MEVKEMQVEAGDIGVEAWSNPKMQARCSVDNVIMMSVSFTLSVTPSSA